MLQLKNLQNIWLVQNKQQDCQSSDEECPNELDQLRAKIKTTAEEHTKQLQTIKEDLKKKTEELDKIEHTKGQEQVTRFQDRLKSSQQERDDLQNQLTKCKTERDTLQNQAEQLAAARVKCDSERTRSQQERDDLQNQLTKCKTERDTLQNQAEQLLKERAAARDKCDSERTRSKKECDDKLEKQNEENKLATKQKNECEDQLAKLQHKMQILEEENKTLGQQRHDCERKLEKCSRYNKDLQVQLDDQVKLVEKLKNELGGLYKEIRDLKRDRDVLQEQHKQKRQYRRDDNEEQLNACRAELATLHLHIQDQEHKMKNMKASYVKHLDELRVDHGNFEKTKRALKRRLEECEEEVEKKAKRYTGIGNQTTTTSKSSLPSVKEN